MPPPPNQKQFGFDPEEYAHYVADLNLTPEQQDELIRAIANIMLAMVDLGFGISPTQVPCGEDGDFSDLIPKIVSDLINCEHGATEGKCALVGTIDSAELEES